MQVFLVIIILISILLFVLKSNPDDPKTTSTPGRQEKIEATRHRKQLTTTIRSKPSKNAHARPASSVPILFFDTETTSFNPGNICQMAYVIYDGETYQGKNLYFNVDWVDPGAQRVHGLSVEKLQRLSGNKDFSCWGMDIYLDFLRADTVVGHNVEFDLRFLKKELADLGFSYHPGSELCTMKALTDLCKLPHKRHSNYVNRYKWPKLDELTNKLLVTPGEISEKGQLIFGNMEGFHDARYDVMATLLCYQKAVSQGVLSGLQLQRITESTVSFPAAK